MPRKRSRRPRRVPSELSYSFSGWTTSSSKKVTLADLSAYNGRAARPLYAVVEVVATATTSTYMVPSNYPTVIASLVSGANEVVGVSAPKLMSSRSTRVRVSAPRNIDWCEYAANGTVLQLLFSALTTGVTVSFSGFVRMQYTINAVAKSVSLEDHTARILGSVLLDDA